MTANAGTNTYTASSIPNGTYIVYAPTTNGGNPVSTKTYAGTVTVSNADAAKTLNYYSITLTAGVGINPSNQGGFRR